MWVGIVEMSILVFVTTCFILVFFVWVTSLLFASQRLERYISSFVFAIWGRTIGAFRAFLEPIWWNTVSIIFWKRSLQSLMLHSSWSYFVSTNSGLPVLPTTALLLVHRKSWDVQIVWGFAKFSVPSYPWSHWMYQARTLQNWCSHFVYSLIGNGRACGWHNQCHIQTTGTSPTCLETTFLLSLRSFPSMLLLTAVCMRG